MTVSYRDGTAITTATDQDGFTASIASYDGQTVVAAGGTSVTRLSYGCLHEQANTTGDPPITIDIPEGTDLLIVATVGYTYGTLNYYSGGTLSVGAEALAVKTDYDDNGDDGYVVIWYKVDPTSGDDKVVTWDWSGTSGTNEGTHFMWACYDNVNDTPFGTSTGQQDSDTTAVSSNLVIESGDMAISFAYNTTSVDWTNATEILEDEFPVDAGCQGAYAETTTVGTITVTATGGVAYTTIASVVIKHA